MMKRIKSILSLGPFSITVGISILVIVIFLTGIPLLDLMELKTYDLRLISRGKKKPSPDIVMAVIDEKSLDTEGRWPWPRSKLARLIDILSDQGAKVVALDIFFSEPDENSRLQLIEQFDEKIKAFGVENDSLKAFIQGSKINANNDLAFAQAIKRSKSKVVLGYWFYMDQSDLAYPLEEDEMLKRSKRIETSRYPITLYRSQEMEYDPFKHAYAPESNIDVLHEATDASGYVNNVPDLLGNEIDGIIRSMLLMMKYKEEIYTSIAVQTVWQYLDKPQLMVRVDEYGIEGVQMGKRHIPTDEYGRILVNYVGPENTFPYYSVTDILNGKAPAGVFRNKIVLVGGTAIGLFDTRNTPVSTTFPGPEIHATIMDNILREDYLHKPEWAKIFDLIAVILLAGITGFAVPRLRPLMGLLFTAGLFVVHILACQWMFAHWGFWVNVIYPLLALALVYTAITVYHYVVEERNKRFLHATFSSYLSPELIEEMVQSENMPELGGEAKTITAFFTDIQSFSTFSEILTAHQLVELLNEYLTAMTDILIEERGTLDKYEGDAIVAFLGAPMDIPDHALRACRVAVNMQNTLAKLREKWRNEKQMPDEADRNTKNLHADQWAPGDKWPRIVHDMKTRIGVNTGEIVVGNMGSTMRMNYTMMGDPVNLAARLEEGAKQFGIYTAVSEYTMDFEYMDQNGNKKKVRDEVETRFIDNIAVVGKTEPVKVYELCAMKGGLTTQEAQLFHLFNKGMGHYLKMEWDAAVECFSESMQIERVPDGKTTPSEVFLKRCREYRETPPVAPGEKWDGVYRMTRK